MYRGCNDSLPLLRNRRTDFLLFFLLLFLYLTNLQRSCSSPSTTSRQQRYTFERVTIDGEKLSGTGVGIKEKEGNLNFTMIDRNFRS